MLYDTLLQDYTPLNKEEPKVKVEGEGEEGDQLLQPPPPSGTSKQTGCNTQEVLAVLGHELGHWKLNHVLKGIIISQVRTYLPNLTRSNLTCPNLIQPNLTKFNLT